MNFNKLNPYFSKIIERELLTKTGSHKETYHISLDIRDAALHFKPGDSIAVLAENDPSLVQEFVTAMHADGNEMITESRSGQAMTLRHFLTCKANLSRLTSGFIKLFHTHETDHDKKNELDRLLKEENRPLLMKYLSENDALDLLRHHVQVPLQELCNQFAPLLPRFYSIASSRLTFPNEVHLTVALSSYAHQGKQRFGVASHFLSHIAEVEKTPIPIYVQTAHHFALPHDHSLPIIMIGPGTGVAPYRAFLQERMHVRAPGKNWLFFGERHRAYEYLYEDYWEELKAHGNLRLDLAFSRDQSEKVYVQHKMIEQGKDIWQWIQDGAYLYVCGDAQHMAKDVEAALVLIIKEEGGFSEADAKAYLKSLRTQKRFLLDIY